MNFLHDPDLKRAYLRRLFTVVAPRYALATSALSFFRDKAWKKSLLTMTMPLDRGSAVLDMACGTGDITRLIADAHPAARVVGCDINPEMLYIASVKLPPSGNAMLTMQDMTFLGLKNGSIDLVVGGYALRNAPDLSVALHETARILKARGSAVFLDFSKSSVPWIAGLQSTVLLLWGALWGFLLHRKPSVYAYLGRSLAAFPVRRRLLSLFDEAGFELRCTLPRMFGLIRIDVLRKREGEHGEDSDLRTA
jgi:demethylmenaquinone methyltransferase/2-methoxy-6-polyprenyl-1,4-benzoquinol methylase